MVLVNNGGGGIFSFLPIAEQVAEDVFTPLWATPQLVDLQGEAEGERAWALCVCVHSADRGDHR